VPHGGAGGDGLCEEICEKTWPLNLPSSSSLLPVPPKPVPPTPVPPTPVTIFTILSGDKEVPKNVTKASRSPVGDPTGKAYLKLTIY
ncbi:unnamed protein product, partial [Closterium sp. Naga37s-1]